MAFCLFFIAISKYVYTKKNITINIEYLTWNVHELISFSLVSFVEKHQKITFPVKTHQKLLEGFSTIFFPRKSCHQFCILILNSETLTNQKTKFERKYSKHLQHIFCKIFRIDLKIPCFYAKNENSKFGILHS